MPTYTYEIITTGGHEDTEQSILDKPFTHRGPQGFERHPTHAGELLTVDSGDVEGTMHVLMPVRRLISGAPAAFLLDGPSGGWSSTGYSKRLHERRAEAILGRPLHKAAR